MEKLTQASQTHWESHRGEWWRPKSSRNTVSSLRDWNVIETRKTACFAGKIPYSPSALRLWDGRWAKRDACWAAGHIELSETQENPEELRRPEGQVYAITQLHILPRRDIQKYLHTRDLAVLWVCLYCGMLAVSLWSLSRVPPSLYAYRKCLLRSGQCLRKQGLAYALSQRIRGLEEMEAGAKARKQRHNSLSGTGSGPGSSTLMVALRI